MTQTNKTTTARENKEQKHETDLDVDWQAALWSSGMILVSGAGGPGFNSQNSPFAWLTLAWTYRKARIDQQRTGHINNDNSTQQTYIKRTAAVCRRLLGLVPRVSLLVSPSGVQFPAQTLCVAGCGVGMSGCEARQTADRTTNTKHSRHTKQKNRERVNRSRLLTCRRHLGIVA